MLCAVALGLLLTGCGGSPTLPPRIGDGLPLTTDGRKPASLATDSPRLSRTLRRSGRPDGPGPRWYEHRRDEGPFVDAPVHGRAVTRTDDIQRHTGTRVWNRLYRRTFSVSER